LSSPDLFWQSIAESVFLPKLNSSSVSWLAGVADQQSNSLGDVLQDMNCTPVAIFSPPDSEILASIDSSALGYGQEVVKRKENMLVDDNDTVTDASTLPSSEITCISQFVCLKMGYKRMTQDIFSHLRQTFGSSECEYCGQLFSVQADLHSHMSIHTGLCPLFCLVFLASNLW